MKFRPCIDIHNGAVKQIVGGSLKDAGNAAVENYISRQDADYYATMYKKDGLTGGHIILLNPPASEYYDATKAQALKALHAYPGGMQIGGGITAENAAEYLEEGASHVIVTSYVFQNGQVRYDRLDRLKKAVGKEHLVLDLSCRRRENSYYIVTNRWQTFTELRLIPEVLEELSGWCDEFLVHGVDVEGKASVQRRIWSGCLRRGTDFRSPMPVELEAWRICGSLHGSAGKSWTIRSAVHWIFLAVRFRMPS